MPATNKHGDRDDIEREEHCECNEEEHEIVTSYIVIDMTP